MSLGNIFFVASGQGGQQNPSCMEFAYTDSSVPPTVKLFHEAVVDETLCLLILFLSWKFSKRA